MNQSICKTDECSGAAIKRGFCNKHYQAFRKSQAPACVVRECTRRSIAKEVCAAHYKRLLETGTVQSSKPVRDYKPGSVCEVVGCGSVTKARGYCSPHYARLGRHGDATGGIYRSVAPVPCPVNGCMGMVRANGLCNKHEKRKYFRGRAGFSGRDCARCQTPIDFGEVSATGRARRRIAMLCDSCKRPNVAWRWKTLRERDGDRCHLCGDFIDFTVRRPNTMSRSVDHIVPVALGGDDKIHNLALAHLRCNIRRQTMPVEEARAMLQAVVGR